VSLAPFFVPVPRRALDLQRVDQAMGSRGDFVHGMIEDRFVLLRRLRGPAQFAHELQRRRPDLVVSGRRLEIGKRLDIATHGRPSCRLENGSFDGIIVLEVLTHPQLTWREWQ
jgi:hypothetical protein